MFFLFFIIIIVLIIILATLNIKLQIEDMQIEPFNLKGKLKNKEGKIRLKIYILRKIKIADINILKNKSKSDEMIKKMKNNSKIDLEVIKNLKSININIENLDLRIFIGLEDAAITAIIVGIISSTIGILLRNKIQNQLEQKYLVIPLYQNKNILNIKIDGIFTIEMRNIIYIILKSMKMRRVKKNVRTSNRRSYAYSNE